MFSEARPHCGVVGIIGQDDIIADLYFSLEGIDHRGHDSGGILTFDGSNHYDRKGVGRLYDFVKPSFKDPESLDYLPGTVGIAHNRYATTGHYKRLLKDAQPEYLSVPFLAGVHNGNIVNVADVLSKSWRKPRNDNDIQALLIPFANYLDANGRMDLESLFAAGKKVMEDAQGAYSAVFLNMTERKPTLFAMTDPAKIRPLVLGRSEERDRWCFASETCVLDTIGYEYVKDVPAGTMIVIRQGEAPVERKLMEGKPANCMFEWIYFARPDSTIEGRLVHDVRHNLGMWLADKYPVEADVVIAPPDSGRRLAAGYSLRSGIPYQEGLMKVRTDRSFILSKVERESTVDSIKVIKPVVNEKRVVVVDDSIVRGTTMKKIIKKIRGKGATEVHLRIGCAPHIGPCYLGIDMTTSTQFFALNPDGKMKDMKQIREELDVNSIGYADIAEIERRLGPDICTGCIRYPFPSGYPKDLIPLAEKLIGQEVDGQRPYEAKPTKTSL